MGPHLPALVVGHRTAHLAVEAVEDLGEGLGGLIGLRAVQLDQGNEKGGALDQRADLREVALADDQIAFPVTGTLADRSSSAGWSDRGPCGQVFVCGVE